MVSSFARWTIAKVFAVGYFLMSEIEAAIILTENHRQSMLWVSTIPLMNWQSVRAFGEKKVLEHVSTKKYNGLQSKDYHSKMTSCEFGFFSLYSFFLPKIVTPPRDEYGPKKRMRSVRHFLSSLCNEKKKQRAFFASRLRDLVRLNKQRYIGHDEMKM